MSREAMQMALEALDSDNPDIQLRAAIALREKLAQPEHDYRTRYDRGCYKCGSHYCPADCPDPTHLVPQQPLCTSPPKTEQEPVAWLSEGGDVSRSKRYMYEMGFKCDPLYTSPPKREWVGLTAYEIQEIHSGNQHWGDFACAIEAKLKEKNHG